MPLCKMNDVVYNATAVTWSEIRCPMQKSDQGDSYFGNVPLSVSPNGIDWHVFDGGF